jgi:hypothetical protein
MFTMGTLKLVFITIAVGVLLLLSVWLYRKLKKVWYDKGVQDERKVCEKQLIKMHNTIASNNLPDGMSESSKTWGLPKNKSIGGMESKDTDASRK